MKVKIAGIVATGLLVAMPAGLACLDKYPPDAHVEVPSPTQPAQLTYPVSVSNVTAHVVTYSTPGFLHETSGNAGQLTTEVFYSVDAAKSAPFPDGSTFARFEVEGGVYAFHSPGFGWEFFGS